MHGHSKDGTEDGLIAELDRMRDREKATQDILDVISRSREDSAPVFEAILKNASLLCNAPIADLDIVDEDGLHLREVATWGPVERAIPSAEWFWPMDSDYGHVEATRTGEIVHVPDLQKTARYLSGDPMTVATVDVEKIRTSLAVPLMKGGRGIGCLVLFRQEQKPFSGTEISLIETFAAQAVIAIENVHQFREVQTRLEREKATREVLQVISQTQDDEMPVFEAILDRAVHLCTTQAAGFLILDEAGTHLRLMCNWGGRADGPFQPGFEIELSDESLLPTAVREGRVISVADLKDSDQYREGYPPRVKLVDKEGVRSWLIVPLLHDGVGFGAMTLSRLEVAPFTADEIALVQTFAAQAVIAIDNVRQFRELQKRLEREATTREILGIITKSRDDENPVFDAILESASRLCGADSASLFLTNEARTHNEIRRVFGHQLLSDAPEVDFWPLDSGQAHTEAVRTGKVVHLPDLRKTELYETGDSTRIHLVDHVGIRTALSVPLMKNGVAVGALALHRLDEANAFSANDITLVESFAAQAVIAIENVRDFREVQQRLEREAATTQILKVINQSRHDETPVFETIVERARELCDSTMSVLILGKAGDAQQVLAAHRGMPEQVVEMYKSGQFSMDPETAIAPRSILNSAVLNIDDMAQIPEYLRGDPRFVAIVDDFGARSNLVVPLVLNDVGIGCLFLPRREVRPYTEDEVKLAETFAAQAVIAIENVRQFKALETLNAELGDRVEEQVVEIERMGRLKRFLPTAVADTVMSSGSENLLKSHRVVLGVLMADIRGFTAFVETAEPEETIEVLQTYHEEMGKLINASGAGVDQRVGDGLMVLFNDPVPCDDPAGEAVRLALAMRTRMAELCAGWRKLGHRLGFGVGVSLGYATVGIVGFEGRIDYSASGTAINLAARLCDKAEDGEILLSPRARNAVEDDIALELKDEMSFKGIREPVEVFKISDSVAD